MTASPHRNITTYPVELADGRSLAPGEDAEVDPKDPVNAHLLDTEQLRKVQQPKPAPDPDPPSTRTQGTTTKMKAGGS